MIKSCQLTIILIRMRNQGSFEIQHRDFIILVLIDLAGGDSWHKRKVPYRGKTVDITEVAELRRLRDLQDFNKSESAAYQKSLM